MKQKKIATKKINTTREKKFQKNLYLLIGVLVFINLLAFYYFEPRIIGYDIKHALYFFWIPVILGIAVFAYYRRAFLSGKYFYLNTIPLKLFGVVFYLLQGLFFSYLTFGFVANMAWVYINKKIAADNPTEIVYCKVDRFVGSKNASIYFKYLNRHESFSITHQLYGEYKNENPKGYKLEIEGQKGLWNYFVVKDWSIKAKE
jgi:hypothetical protein